VKQAETDVEGKYHQQGGNLEDENVLEKSQRRAYKKLHPEEKVITGGQRRCNEKPKNGSVVTYTDYGKQQDLSHP